MSGGNNSSSNVAVLIVEGTGLDESEELTNSLLDHIHDHVVEVEGEEASLVVFRGQIGGILGFGTGLEGVDGSEDDSHEATEEGGQQVPGLVTSASRELHEEANWVSAQGGKLGHNVDDALHVTASLN